MLAIIAKSILKPEKKDEFIAVAKELIEKSRQEDGCISYDLYADSKQPEVVAFIETWRDFRAIVAHNKTEHFEKIVPKLADLREGDMQINIFTKLDI